MQMKMRGSLGERWCNWVEGLFNDIAAAASNQPCVDGWKCDAVRLTLYEKGDGLVVAEFSNKDLGRVVTTTQYEWTDRGELVPWLEEMHTWIYDPERDPDAEVVVFRPTLLSQH